MGCGASSSDHRDENELINAAKNPFQDDLQDGKQLSMRERRESLEQILHYPDELQQLSVLQQMQDQLRNEMYMEAADSGGLEDVSLSANSKGQPGQSSAQSQPMSSSAHQSVGRSTPRASVQPVVQPRASVQPVVQPRASVQPVSYSVSPRASIQPVVQPRASVQPVSFSVSPRASIQPVGQPTQPVSYLVSLRASAQSASKPLVIPTSSGDTANTALIQRQQEFYDQLLKLVNYHQQELAKMKNNPNASIPPSALPVFFGPGSNLGVQTTQAIVPSVSNQPPNNKNEAFSGDQSPLGLDPYHSGIAEQDNCALARLLKKHFNNFILECEFNAAGNNRAVEILRSNRKDRLEIDHAYSTGHNLTPERTKHIADLFLKYSMTVIDAQHWGGELRYAIKRPSSTESIGALAINGSVSYLSSDRVMKFDAPYQVEVVFVLQKD